MMKQTILGPFRGLPRHLGILRLVEEQRLEANNPSHARVIQHAL